MTSLIQYVFLGITVGVVASVAVMLLARSITREWLSPSEQQPSVPPSQSPSGVHRHLAQETPSTESQGEKATTIDHASLSENMVTISLERLQSIGVRFARAERRPLERTIRTEGRVEVDERRVAHVHIKLEGWIDKLSINYTGERVQRGQILFTLYSPELVATEQEYLLALKGKRTLGDSVFPEA